MKLTLQGGTRPASSLRPRLASFIVPVAFVAAYFVDDAMSSPQLEWLTTPLGWLCAGQLVLQMAAYIWNRFQVYCTFSVAVTVHVGRMPLQE